MLGFIFAALVAASPAEARRHHHAHRPHRHHHRAHRHKRIVLRPAIPHAAPHGLVWTWVPGHYNHRHVWVSGQWVLRIRL